MVKNRRRKTSKEKAFKVKKGRKSSKQKNLKGELRIKKMKVFIDGYYF